jgi:hypothetical protein
VRAGDLGVANARVTVLCWIVYIRLQSKSTLSFYLLKCYSGIPRFDDGEECQGLVYSPLLRRSKKGVGRRHVSIKNVVEVNTQARKIITDK